mmetsp:Transcript_6882/g.10689  ORF Transcript_6882/g.10689 Transcript_6882/m.10689 type:complete len:301 (+) Transcript_6882:431-1333(+)
MKMKAVIAAAASLLLTSTASAQNFGVDVSFPIHYNFLASDDLSATNEVFGNDRVELYSKYMDGCIKRYGGHRANSLCSHNEADRLRLNLEQPKLQTNYTEIGFKKTKLSDETWSMLKTFWAGVKAKENFPDSLWPEAWPKANTYVNHWESDSKMHPLDTKLRQVLWDEIEKKMQEWIPTASSFSKSSLYGVRVYREGHILAPHVDRDPLISSAIINIDQEVTEPWPLEVIGHDGFAHNITISPGEVILYESHSIIHGRPFALKGSYYANAFVHFKPDFEAEEVDSSSEDSSSDDDSRDEL